MLLDLLDDQRCVFVEPLWIATNVETTRSALSAKTTSRCRAFRPTSNKDSCHAMMSLGEQETLMDRLAVTNSPERKGTAK